jgi:DNA polymerase-3 subunit gamma/tau
VATDSIVERLQFIVDTEGVQADPAALRLLARRAGGSMRDSQSLLEQLLAFCGNKIAESDVHTMLGTAHGSRMLAITQHVIDRNAGAALAELDAALREGVDVGQLAEQLLGYWRDMMAVLVGCRADLMLHAAAADFDALKECGERWGLETVLAAVQILDQAIVRMRQSTQVRTLVEIALVRICNLEDLDSLPALLAQFGGDGGLASASPKAPAAPKPVRRGDPPTTPVRPAAKSGPSDEASAPSPAPPPRESGNPRGQDSRTGAHGVTAAEPPRDVAAPIEIPISRVSISSVGDSDDYTEDKGNPAFEPVFELTAENAEQKWRETLTDIGGMTAEFGGNYERVAISGPNQLVVTLRAAYNKEWCERPDVKRKLETTLSRLGGRDLRIGFCVGAEPPVARPERRPTAQSMMQRRREVEQHPLVQQAMELFEAEVVRVDGPAR